MRANDVRRLVQAPMHLMAGPQGLTTFARRRDVGHVGLVEAAGPLRHERDRELRHRSTSLCAKSTRDGGQAGPAIARCK